MLVVGNFLISENLDVGNLPTPPNDSPDRDDSKKKNLTFLSAGREGGAGQEGGRITPPNLYPI